MKSKTHPSLLFAAGLTSLAASATSSAADYTWGGGTSTWTDTSATGWNGGPPIAGDTATINGGLVNFAGNDTFGSAGTTTSANANPDLTINATLQNSNLSDHFASAGRQFRAGSGYWVFRGSPNFNVLPPRPNSSKMP